MKIIFSSLFFVTLLLSPLANATKESDRIAAIEALKTSSPSILNAYLDLMEANKLIHQEDVRLKYRLLLKRDGGLCAFTAMTDSLEAMSEYYQVSKSAFEGRPDYVLYQVMEKMRDNTGIDGAHEGAVLKDLVIYTNELLEDKNLNSIASVAYSADMSLSNPEYFVRDYWKLNFIGVISNDSKEGHTMVVIGKDLAKKIIYVSDPNYPNQVTTVHYKYSEKQGLYVYLNIDDFGENFSPAIVDELLELHVQKD